VRSPWPLRKFPRHASRSMAPVASSPSCPDWCSLHMSERIRFCGFTDHPLEVFAGAAATVLCSGYAGFALVLNEAMVVCTPPIAYDLNYGPAEVIRHEVDGLLVPPGDVRAMSETKIRILWSGEWLGLFASLVTRTLSVEGQMTRSTAFERTTLEGAWSGDPGATNSPRPRPN
jgi:glycosyltransferase involved in cell wall biosynthesis